LHVDKNPFITRLQGLVNEKFPLASEQQQRAFLLTFFAEKKVREGVFRSDKEV
jgi:hypothetical protein